MSVAVGSPAPEFTLPDADRAPVSLVEFRGKKAVLLVFYPFAFSGTCTGELTALRDDITAYGVLHEQGGMANRGTFLIGLDGVVTFAEVNGPGEARDQSAWKRAVDALPVG